MDADKGKRSTRAKKFASGKLNDALSSPARTKRLLRRLVENQQHSRVFVAAKIAPSNIILKYYVFETSSISNKHDLSNKETKFTAGNVPLRLNKCNYQYLNSSILVPACRHGA
jgi:hypothetical protein